jgi:hypothetical protein
MPTREQVFSSLFSLLQTVGATNSPPMFNSFSRRFTAMPGNIPPLQLPQLILWEQPERSEFAGPSMPRKRIWNALVVVYFINPSKTVPGATIINPMIDAIEAALRYDNPATNRLTLGGLVEWCRIEGQTIKETGDTDSQGLGGVVIPVRILVP